MQKRVHGDRARAKEERDRWSGGNGDGRQEEQRRVEDGVPMNMTDYNFALGMAWGEGRSRRWRCAGLR